MIVVESVSCKLECYQYPDHWHGRVLFAVWVSTELLQEHNLTSVTPVTSVTVWLLCMCYVCAMLCYAMLCYAMLCYAILGLCIWAATGAQPDKRYARNVCHRLFAMHVLCMCYAMLCYAMLCYAMLS